jgi:protein involved in polysaccharide export with SLBB domain
MCLQSIKDLVPVRSSISLIVLLLSVLTGSVNSQTTDGRGRNNPYSPSPSGKPRVQQQSTGDVKPRPEITVAVNPAKNVAQAETRPTIAKRTYAAAKTVDPPSRPLTEIYKVGVGDVLFVNLKNSAQGSGYFTVRANGTIDFPLAGENVIVAGQAVDSIKGILESGITLFRDPQVEVTVREYGSHKVTVSGMVDNPGEKSLQREAIPLFVIRADAVIDPKATKAIITRGPLLKVETCDLRDSNTDSMLLYPGNSVEFTNESGSRDTGSFYYISGEVLSAGQKQLSSGLTLYQAIVASGGSKGDPKKAIIRRKNDKGVFAIFEHNLRAIRDGKSADPALSSGDIVEIRN